MESKDKLYRKTPIMGWSSWNAFRVDINEEKMKEQAKRLVDSGLADYGYEYFNIDDGFFGGRSPEGKLLYHPQRFPNGIRCLSDCAHELGLKAGIYSEGGRNTCAHYWDNEGDNGVGVGLYGYEEQDLRQFLIDENFDFIKVDWCGGQKLGLEEEMQYTKIAKIIDQIRHETHRQLVFNVCRWQFPGKWVVDIADSWRTGGDIRPTFESVIYQIDKIKPLRKYCGPGHVNDLDMMQVGNGLTLEEEKTHFAMWCMMSTPLMIGCDLTKISEETLAVLKNRELIAIDQDVACLQAYVVKEVRGEDGALLGEVWVKDLEKENSPLKAVAFLNRSEKPLNITASQEELGLAGNVLSVREICVHKDLQPESTFSVTVPAHGVSVMRIEAEDAVSKVFDEPDVMEPEKFVPISAEELEKRLADGAVLVDVRSLPEYEAGHLDGAVNVPFTALEEQIGQYIREKTAPMILYCTTGKRSSQAKSMLDYLGYSAVYYLGGVDL